MTARLALDVIAVGLLDSDPWAELCAGPESVVRVSLSPAARDRILRDFLEEAMDAPGVPPDAPVAQPEKRPATTRTRPAQKRRQAGAHELTPEQRDLVEHAVERAGGHAPLGRAIGRAECTIGNILAGRDVLSPENERRLRAYLDGQPGEKAQRRSRPASPTPASPRRAGRWALTAEQRALIERGVELAGSQAALSRALGRAASTASKVLGGFERCTEQLEEAVRAFVDGHAVGEELAKAAPELRTVATAADLEPELDEEAVRADVLEQSQDQRLIDLVEEIERTLTPRRPVKLGTKYDRERWRAIILPVAESMGPRAWMRAIGLGEDEETYRRLRTGKATAEERPAILAVAHRYLRDALAAELTPAHAANAAEAQRPEAA